MALVLPVVGFVGIGFAVAARRRGCPLGNALLTILIGATVAGFVIGVFAQEILE